MTDSPSPSQDKIVIFCDINEEYLPLLDEQDLIRAAKAALVVEEMAGEQIELSIAISDDEEVREMNRTYRGVDKTTDVLSFSAEEEPEWGVRSPVEDQLAHDDEQGEDEEAHVFKLPPEAPQSRYLGDIIISYPQAERQAADFNNSPAREVQELIIHGVFHLLGYDHEIESDREFMRAKEEAAARILDQAQQNEPA